MIKAAALPQGAAALITWGLLLFSGAGGLQGRAVTLPLVATWLEASLGLNQGPAFYCLLWAVPTLLAYSRLERHLVVQD